MAHAGVGCAYYGPACNTRGHTHVDHRVWVQVCVHVCVGTFDGDQLLTVMAASRGCVCVRIMVMPATHEATLTWITGFGFRCVCMCVCVCVCMLVL